MEEEWEASEEGVFVPEGGEEKTVYSDVFKDRERAQGGGTTYKTASDTSIKAIRNFAASISLNDSTTNTCVSIIQSWPNHQIYNPGAMLFAALFVNYSKSDALTKDSYSKFLAELQKAGTALKHIGNDVKHADVIRYINFFVFDSGRRGIDKHPL